MRTQILLDNHTIINRVKELAVELDSHYAGATKPVIAIVMLRGAFIFAADLMRYIKTPLHIEFMRVSSYIGSTSGGQVHLLSDISSDIVDRDVLIIEDIVDTGRTLSYLQQLMEERGAKDVRICALLDKPSRRVVDINAHHTGFVIPDKFVVGYGLDCNEYHRNLPDIHEVLSLED